MKYKEAMCMASSVDGIIKCTWAKVYDAEGNDVFTLVNNRFSKETVIPVGEDYYHDRDGMQQDVHYDVQESGSGTQISMDLAWTTEKIFEAVVNCTEFVDGYRVPVTLYADNVGKAMKHSLINVIASINRERVRQYMWNRDDDALYRKSSYIGMEDQSDEYFESYVKNTAQEIQRLGEVLWDAVANGVPFNKTRLKRYEALYTRRMQQIEDVYSGKIFYVKVKCFEWFPTSATPPSKDEVTRAKRALDNAKLILAAATATAVIG